MTESGFRADTATVVVDSSALVAIVLGEPDADALVATMARHAGALTLGAASLVEAGIVVAARHGPDALDDLYRLVDLLQIEVADFDLAQARLAIGAWQRFGKGRHGAGLNFGDCLAYALTADRGGSLLFKGADFPLTDIAIAR